MDETSAVVTVRCFVGWTGSFSQSQSSEELPTAAVLLSQSVSSLASCSRWFISLGCCSVKSELSCQTLTVPAASPAARSWVCLVLNSKQYTGHSSTACFMETAGFWELFSKSNRCTSPIKQKHSCTVTDLTCRMLPTQSGTSQMLFFRRGLDFDRWHHCKTAHIYSAVTWRQLTGFCEISISFTKRVWEIFWVVSYSYL